MGSNLWLFRVLIGDGSSISEPEYEESPHLEYEEDIETVFPE